MSEKKMIVKTLELMQLSKENQELWRELNLEYKKAAAEALITIGTTRKYREGRRNDCVDIAMKMHELRTPRV